MIGIQVTKNDINQTLGNLSRRMFVDFDDIGALKAWSDITQQADIQLLGFTEDEAYLIKLIIDELNQLRTIWMGAADLANAKDFRVQPHKAVGLGL